MKPSDLATASTAARSGAVDAKNRVVDSVPTVILRWLPVIVGIVLIGVGSVLQEHQLSIFNQILILGIFGIAYDLLFGYTGLLSFGHAAFFGAGAYTGIYVTNEFALPLVGIMGIAVVVGVVLSLAIGLVALRTTGVYFAMLTLAIAQLLYILARRADEIGGASGLPAFQRPDSFLPIDLGDSFQFFVLTVVLLVVTYVVLRRVLSSPVGDVFRAIRENEERAEMVGYSTFWYKIAALTISGVFSTIAGVLFGLFLFFSSPNFLFWTHSGDVLLQTLFGGAGTLVGPVVGAGFIVLAEEVLNPITDQWRLFLGITFVLVILFFPTGIVGLFKED